MGESIGWVQFDPYEYKFTGDKAVIGEILSNGPREQVRTGIAEHENVEDAESEELENEQSNINSLNRDIHEDRIRDATTEERINSITRELNAYGVVVNEVTQKE